MRIRWKLLILLLAIALIPLVAVAMLANRSTYRMGERIGNETGRVLTERTRQQMRLLVGGQATLMDREARIVELALAVQAREVERCLASPPGAPQRVYHARDYDDRNSRPPGMMPSAHHVRRSESGEGLPIDITLEEQVFNVASGADEASVTDDIQRLSAMTPLYRTLYEQNAESIHWMVASLENGVHTCYPGHGGYPESYDARTRLWYRRVKALGRLCWTLPYVDASSGRMVLTVGQPIHRPDGEMAGVSAIDVTVGSILRHARLPEFKSSVGRLVMPAPKTGLDFETPKDIDPRDYPPEQLDLLIIAQPDEPSGGEHWQAPPRGTWLETDDAEQRLSIVRDMLAGRPGLLQVRQDGRDMLWAYAEVLQGAYLVLAVSADEGVAEAAEARQTVLSLTRSQLRLTRWAVGVVGLIVIVLALTGSRTVTRPVRRLARAAQRIAAGDFETRVEIRTRDELGDLGRAFNEMVPQLQDRMKLRQSLTLAMEVQQHLLPSGAPQVEGLEVAGRSIYCDETGGDYYDFLDLSALGPRELGIAVGDVTGHGIAAALLMTAARALLRSHASQPGTLADLMRDINRHLSADIPVGRFMTLYYMAIDAQRRSVRWANAGHDPPFLYDPAADAFTELAGGSLPLGIMETETYEEFRYDGLLPGQVLVVGTDGIWETHSPDGDEFGKNALHEIIRRHANESAEAIGQAITQALDIYRDGKPQQDDVTMVVVKIK